MAHLLTDKVTPTVQGAKPRQASGQVAARKCEARQTGWSRRARWQAREAA